ncbi:hypothetical protein [Mesorhizobium sp.]|uniref:hypothetical protein n=1 Tax=Mesorhizobium sp. TaxID=1871066 RepID=UPI0025EB5E23|nr:hypothetical protein [Mesorhizobium sp.]
MGAEATAALVRLYDAVRLHGNLFQPSFKLGEKTRIDARVIKRFKGWTLTNDSAKRGTTALARLMAAMTRPLSRVRTGTHSVQPVAISVKTIVCKKLPDEELPEWATKSTSTYPGGGSFQSPKVRTGTDRTHRRTESGATALPAASYSTHFRTQAIHRYHPRAPVP